MKTALILGISGQDGSYLAELLLGKGYEVHGIIRRQATFGTQNIDHIFDKLTLHYGDVLDPMSIRRVLTLAKPDEVYNLAAQSHVKTSFDQPVYSFDAGAMGCLHCLEAVRDYRDGTSQEVRFYQASSSEMFGDSLNVEYSGPDHTPRPKVLDEASAFAPCSPYACAKAAAFYLVRTYRQAYGLHASNGILFNHESPRRGETFVTRKITRAAARIRFGLQDKLYLGNLDASRDWGYAGDFVRAMWMMLQQAQPEDYVVATGVSCTIKVWLQIAFDYVHLEWPDYVTVDPRYFRPNEVGYLRGDASKAKGALGWEPEVHVKALCERMMVHDLDLAEREAASL